MLVWMAVAAAVAMASLFNYYLNLAPGSDPEDFRLGPQELGITCDCFLNTLILGGIVVVSLAAASGAFDTRTELHLAGGISFALVTLAGIAGRRRRHREWRETHNAIRRSVPIPPRDPYQDSSMKLIFDNEEEDEDEFYPDDL